MSGLAWEEVREDWVVDGASVTSWFEIRRGTTGSACFDAVCQFVLAIGRELQRAVGVTSESAHDDVMMRYEPSTDALVRVPPPPAVSLLGRLRGDG